MENRPIGPEEQDETTEATNTKKKRGSKLSSYLSGLRGREVSSHHEEGQETEKPKRMQRLFARLFPGIVEKPAHLNSDTPHQEHEFNHDVWANIARFASRIERGAEDAAEPDNEAGPDESARLRSVTVPLGSSLARDAQPNLSTPENTATSSPVSPDLTPDFAPLAHSGREVSVDLGQRDRQLSVDAQPIERNIPQETIIERRGSNALPIVLVAAEHIGRKRADKKLEARTDKKIGSIKKEQDHSSVLQKELEKVVSENKQQIEQLKKARSAMELGTSQEVPTPEARVAPEKHEVLRPETRWASERAPRQEMVSRAPSSETVRPDNIAEQVAEAAEHDVPVERAFERSHEVKDDDSHGSSVVTGAASVGSVVATSAAAGMKAAPKVSDSGSDELPFASEEEAREFYRRAAARGFWSAICLIVLGTIAYLVVKY